MSSWLNSLKEQFNSKSLKYLFAVLCTDYYLSYLEALNFMYSQAKDIRVPSEDHFCNFKNCRYKVLSSVCAECVTATCLWLKGFDILQEINEGIFNNISCVKTS